MRPSAQKQKSVSVVVPAYREELGIVHAIDVIESVLSREVDHYEIIVVDDGSPDKTFEQVAQVAARNSRVRGLRLSRNFGKEAALLAGLRAAAGDAVITIDADLQHPPALIPDMLRAWYAGAQVVNAVKRSRGEESLFARWRADMFNGLITKLCGVDLRNASDYKLLDRCVVDILINSLRENRRFYRGLAEWIGFEQTNLAFDVEPRHNGASSWSTWSLVRLAITALVSFTSAPLRIVTVLGAATLLLGVITGGDALWSWANGRAVSGFATLLVTLLLIGSSVMISLGVIGEYIAKIYEEIKGRPSYLLASTCGSPVNRLDKPAIELAALPAETASVPQSAGNSAIRV
ncbi:MAG: glycosyltransferase family 2 protein [Gammaproteobacteria bacterium]